MLGQKIEWEKAKELYRRGIITKTELGQAGVDYINEVNTPETRDAAFIRACKVDAYMNKIEGI